MTTETTQETQAYPDVDAMPSGQARALAHVAIQLHKMLGVPWGGDPYSALAALTSTSRAGAARDASPREDVDSAEEFALHAYYGPCDGFGEGGTCSECTTIIREGRAENARLRAALAAAPPARPGATAPRGMMPDEAAQYAQFVRNGFTPDAAAPRETGRPEAGEEQADVLVCENHGWRYCPSCLRYVVRGSRRPAPPPLAPEGGR